LNTIVAILLVHFVADFLLQSRWMASNKSKRIDALALHVAVYTVCLTAVFGWQFGLLNGAIHFGVDWVTSRWSSRLWAKQDWHNFFAVIGFDQFIHTAVLALTAGLASIWFLNFLR